MTKTSPDGAATLPIHLCVDCRALPIRPFDKADEEPGVEYRPRKPLVTVSGGPRSRRCHRHARSKRKTGLFDQRIAMRAKRRGLSRELQIALWEFQGRQCPCGRKRSQEIPPGVALDHVHGAPCIVAGVHDEKTGCLECVTGFFCAHCNTEIIGRLEGAHQKLDDPRPVVITSLRSVADALADPFLQRLLAERPELLATEPAGPRSTIGETA